MRNALFFYIAVSSACAAIWCRDDGVLLASGWTDRSFTAWYYQPVALSIRHNRVLYLNGYRDRKRRDAWGQNFLADLDLALPIALRLEAWANKMPVHDDDRTDNMKHKVIDSCWQAGNC